MFLVAKGVSKYEITASGNVETAAGPRYKLPIQRWSLGSNITGNINFPNSNNHKNLEFDVGSYFIEANNASDAITYADTDSTVLKLLGSGTISAGELDGSGNPTASSVSRSYSMDVFGSFKNSTDTGILPTITAATKATNAVFTFASDVTAGTGTNGTLSTTPPNNVFRIGFRGPEDDQGDWMRTLFTVTNISGNGLTVTCSNNTTSFPTWSSSQSRVGTISLASDDDRIFRGTSNGYQGTNSSNSQTEYGVSEVTFNDSQISGGAGGGNVATEQVLGSGYHVLTLRPGRWYSFRCYSSYREDSRGRSDTRWQISGIPSTMTKSWGSAENSPNITGDGSSMYFNGYVTENTLITISGESENNVRNGMPGGGGPKTAFMGGSVPPTTSGTISYAASVNGNPYSPDYFAFNGAGITKDTDGTVTAGIDFTSYTGVYSRTGII